MLTPYEGGINPALPVQNGKGNCSVKQETKGNSHLDRAGGNQRARDNFNCADILGHS